MNEKLCRAVRIWAYLSLPWLLWVCSRWRKICVMGAY